MSDEEPWEKYNCVKCHQPFEKGDLVVPCDEVWRTFNHGRPELRDRETLAHLECPPEETKNPWLGGGEKVVINFKGISPLAWSILAGEEPPISAENPLPDFPGTSDTIQLEDAHSHPLTLPRALWSIDAAGGLRDPWGKPALVVKVTGYPDDPKFELMWASDLAMTEVLEKLNEGLQ